MAMFLKTTRAMLDQLSGSEALRLEEALALMQCVCNDVRWENHMAVADLPVRSWESLQRSLAALTFTLKTIYQDQRSDLSERCGFEVQELETETRKLENMEAELRSALNKVDALRDRKKTAEEGLKALGNRPADVTALERETQTLEAELRKLRDIDLEALRKDKERLEKDCQAQREEKDRFEREELTPAKNALKAAKDALKAAEDALKQAKTDRDKAKADCETAEKERKQAEADKAEWEKKKIEAENAKADAEKARTDAETQQQTLIQDPAAAIADEKDIRESLENYRKDQYEPAQKNLKAAQAEKEELEKQKKDAEEKLKEQRTKNQTIRSEITGLQTTKLAHQQSKIKLEKQLLVEKENCKIKEAELKEVRKKFNKAHASLEGLLNDIKDLNEKLDTNDDAGLQLDLQERKETLKQALEDVKNRKQQITDLDQQIQDAKAAIQTHQKTVETKTILQKDLEAQQKKLEQDVKRAETALAPLESPEHQASLRVLRERQRLLGSILTDLELDSEILAGQKDASAAFQADAAIRAQFATAETALNLLQDAMKQYLTPMA